VTQAKDRGTSSVGFQWPTDYKYISTYFGGSTPFQPGGGHGGLDLANASGTPIYAASDGTVTAEKRMMINGSYYAYGQYIVIGHNARWSTLYGHLQSFAVSEGQEVKRGQVIGYMGSTGWSTGPHLHFEIWDYSSRVNPLSYLP
jgi:murein DD-endopeptidase MepM/ murein hydrolase activator NlpD